MIRNPVADTFFRLKDRLTGSATDTKAVTTDAERAQENENLFKAASQVFGDDNVTCVTGENVILVNDGGHKIEIFYRENEIRAVTGGRRIELFQVTDKSTESAVEQLESLREFFPNAVET